MENQCLKLLHQYLLVFCLFNFPLQPEEISSSWLCHRHLSPSLQLFFHFVTVAAGICIFLIFAIFILHFKRLQAAKTADSVAKACLLLTFSSAICAFQQYFEQVINYINYLIHKKVDQGSQIVVIVDSFFFKVDFRILFRTVRKQIGTVFPRQVLTTPECFKRCLLKMQGAEHAMQSNSCS